MSDGGKGSAPRPFSVSHADFSARWNQIFGKEQPRQPDPEPMEFRCTCGDPLVPDVVHRSSGPCYAMGERP